jgi:hypothetical protein
VLGCSWRAKGAGTGTTHRSAFGEENGENDFLRLRRDHGRLEGVCNPDATKTGTGFSLPLGLPNGVSTERPWKAQIASRPQTFKAGLHVGGALGRLAIPHRLQTPAGFASAGSPGADEAKCMLLCHRKQPATRNSQLARYRYQHQPTPTNTHTAPDGDDAPNNQKRGRGAARETQLRVACYKFVILGAPFTF